MEENKNLVTEQVAENVEIATEEIPKTYTEAEFNAKLDEVLPLQALDTGQVNRTYYHFQNGE